MVNFLTRDDPEKRFNGISVFGHQPGDRKKEVARVTEKQTRPYWMPSLTPPHAVSLYSGQRKLNHGWFY